MFFSIIIPTYNRASMLKDTINSILEQNFDDYEIIVSDNNSNDNTEEIIKSIKSDKIKYFKNNKNYGMNKNWEISLYERANGNYALLLSDDDYLIYNSYFSEVYEIITKNKDKNISLVLSDQIIKFEDKNINLNLKYNLPNFIDGKEYFYNYRNGKYKHINSTISCFFDIEKAKKMKCFTEKSTVLDTIAWNKLMLDGNIIYLPKITSVYRKHSNNTVCKIWSIDLELQALDDYYNLYLFSIKYNIDTKKSLKVYKRNINSYIIWRYNIYSKNNRIYAKNFLKNVNKHIKYKNFFCFNKNGIRYIFNRLVNIFYLNKEEK